MKALKDYIKTLPLDPQKQILITLVADFDPFQAASLNADPNIKTQQFTHMGGLADQKQNGANVEYYEDPKKDAHAIGRFFNDINKLSVGVYKWNEIKRMGTPRAKKMKMNRRFLFQMTIVCCLGCNTGDRTPKDVLLSKIEGPVIAYKEDSIALLSILNENLVKKVPPFNSKEYSDSTVILLDTVIYSTKKDKGAFFVLVKNPTSRLADPDRSYDFYYDGFCYLGSKSSSNVWSIEWFRVFNIVTYYDFSQAKARIRKKYFEELSSVKDTLGNSYYKYNVNDTGFWNSPAWRK